MPFAKGQSGNPAGRPPGARNRTTLLMEALLAEQGEEVTCAAIARAREGDAAALRLCLDRLLPRGRERPVPFALPTLETGADARAAVSRIVGATGTGELTPPEALSLLRVVEKGAEIVLATEAAEKARDERWRREHSEFWNDPDQQRLREEQRDRVRREKDEREAAEHAMAEREQAARVEWARRAVATIMVEDSGTAGDAADESPEDPAGSAGGAGVGAAAPDVSAERAVGGGRHRQPAGRGRRRPAAGHGGGRGGNKAKTGRGPKGKTAGKSTGTNAAANRGPTVTECAAVEPAALAAAGGSNARRNNACGNNENTMQEGPSTPHGPTAHSAQFSIFSP